MRNRRRRAKVKTIPIGGGSERTRRRVAMALAWNKLPWPTQEEHLRAAADLLQVLCEVV